MEDRKLVDNFRARKTEASSGVMVILICLPGTYHLDYCRKPEPQ